MVKSKKRRSPLRRLAAAGLALTTVFSFGLGASQTHMLPDIGFSAFAAQQDFTFEFDAESAQLTVFGDGDMPDHCEEQPAPWSGLAALTHSVVVSDGITSLGENAFAGFNLLTLVELPDSVTEISDIAFDCDADITVTASGQSFAAEFAAKNNIKFIPKAVVSPSDTPTDGKVTDSDIAEKKPSDAKVEVTDTSHNDDNAASENFPHTSEIPEEQELQPEPEQTLSLTASPFSYNKIKLTWNAVEDASGYVVYCSTSADGKYTTLSDIKTGTSYVHPSRSLDVVYYYKLRSYKLVNKSRVYSEYCEPVSCVIHIDPPMAASGVSVNDIAYNKLEISWDASDDADGYTVYCGNSADGKFTAVKAITSPTVTSYVHSSRKPGQTYYYQVIPFKTAGSKKIFAQENQIYSGATYVAPPEAVNDIAVECTAYNKLKISWELVPDAYGYTVYCADALDGTYKKVANVSRTRNYYVHSSRVLEKTYYYKVASYKKAGVYSIYADQSNSQSCATYLHAPNAPTLKAMVNGTVKFSGSKVVGALKYEIYRAEEGGEYALIKTVGSTPSFIDQTTVPGKNYSYKMAAIRGQSRSNDSAVSYVTAVISPTTLTYAASASYDSVLLKWNKVSGASGINVYVSQDPETNFEKVASVSSKYTSYTVSGLETNKTYYFKAETFKNVANEIGCGEFGNMRTAIPTLNAPAGLSLSAVGKTNIFVQWKLVDGADGYDIYCGNTPDDMTLAAEETLYYHSIKELETNKTYYCKVCAYRTVNGEKLCGKFSDVKKVKLTANLSKTVYSWPYSYKVVDHQVPASLPPAMEKASNINTILGGDTSRKVIYLTMDCGYPSKCTDINLNTLKEKNVKATFFITVPFAEGSHAQIQRMIDEGHILGNHTKNHIYMQAQSASVITSEVKAVENYLYDNFGYKTKYFRYPYGSFSQFSQQQLMDMGYTSVGWSFAYNDFSKKQPSVSYALPLVTKNIHPGAVFLLHNSSSTNTAMLGDFIDNARALGYEFETLDDIVL